MVNRGPQLVHEMKGCRYRRSAGSASSAKQSAHTATSGEASVRPAPPVLRVLGAIVKPVPPRGSSSRLRTRVTTAIGGASSTRRRAKASTAAGSPSTSPTTPAGVLATDPARPSSAASA